MRSLGLLAVVGLVGLKMGCGSVLTSPDGGGGGTGGSAPCVRNGISYPPGTSIPSGDCNSCFCQDGQIACTAVACPPIDAGACAFDTTYTYGDTGGLVAYEETTTLAPPASYTRTRSPRFTDPPDISCAPALPACGTEDLWSPSDVMRAVADADVQAALAMPTPPIYGRDTRPVDGSVFQFRRVDGRGFLAGTACGSASTLPACTEVPAGVSRLVNLLRALDEQQLRDPSCAALR
jgi:hypothetical protein